LGNAVKKGNFALEQAMKAKRGVVVYSNLFLASALDWVWWALGPVWTGTKSLDPQNFQPVDSRYTD
jgi:hypothetical protein